jgi:hypothetical protein
MVRKFLNKKTGKVITYSEFKSLEYPNHYDYKELYDDSNFNANEINLKKNEKINKKNLQ